MEDSQLAAALSASLIERIGQQRFELWFGSQAQLCARETCLTVKAVSSFVRDWLRSTFAEELRACWGALVGDAASVEFEVDATVAASGPKSHIAQPKSDVPEAPPAPAVNTTAVAETTNRRDTQLIDFVVGAGNEYAFRAADLTARARQQASPLLFCGPTGVGKTHLLRAIVREFRRHQPRASAVYLSAEQFTTSFVEAVCGRGLPSFRLKCRGSNLLAIDDLQFIAGKQRTSEELLHTIDTLAADGKQLVLASDRPLAELRSFGPELVSRLSGGLICELDAPDFATRLEIVRRLALEVGLALDEDLCKLVATQVTSSPRELRGAVNRLQAVSLSYDRPISRELAEQSLADMARQSTRAVRLADVQKAVCDVFGVEPSALRSDRKGRSVSEPRMIGMWLARKYTRAAWSEIGEFFGRKSHSTVISAHKRVEQLISDQARVGMNSGACSVEDAIRRLEAALRSA
jgi:chromosomal replication initiator protein